MTYPCDHQRKETAGYDHPVPSAAEQPVLFHAGKQGQGAEGDYRHVYQQEQNAKGGSVPVLSGGHRIVIEFLHVFDINAGGLVEL